MIVEADSIQRHTQTPTEWWRTGDPECPSQTRQGEQVWTVRVNDFPDEALYTLLIDAVPAGDLESWPEAWIRRE